jgi:Uma2 family endonuclease
MITFIGRDEQEIHVPSWVRDIASFRRWTDEDGFPKDVNVWWLKGEVWIDTSKEDIFSHLVVKNAYAYTLTGIAENEQFGLLIPDGLLLSNFAGDISGNPDGTFITNSTLLSDRVRLIEGKRGGYVEIQGSPDMVLEVVSRRSLKKDLDILRQAYWEAGIPEYWLVDARGERLKFDILRHAARGYAATPKRGGWIKSTVFGRSFRLVRCISATGYPEYKLAWRK